MVLRLAEKGGTMRKHLVFIDSDQDYSRRLAGQLRRISENGLSIKCFSTEEECLKNILKMNIDMVISDTDLDREGWKKLGKYDLIKAEDFDTSPGGNIVFVGSWREKQNNLSPSFFYRYRPVNDTYQKIMRILSMTDLNQGKSSCAKVYYFDSPFGGSGVTGLSGSFAAYLAREKSSERVLHMSIYSGNPVKLDQKSSWSSIFLAAKTGRVKLGPRMRMREIQSDRGYFFFSDPLSPTDAFELEERDKKNIFKAALTSYDELVIDGEEKLSIFKNRHIEPDMTFLVWPYAGKWDLLERLLERLRKKSKRLIFLLSKDCVIDGECKREIQDTLSYDREQLSKDPEYSPDWGRLFYDR